VAADTVNLPQEEGTQIQSNAGIKEFKVPCNNVNQKLSSFLGQKATIIFNMKLDDPQATQQFPALQSIYKQYHDKGLNVLAFPTEQGFFEPDDDEMLRKKATEFYQFGEYPGAVVFDKVLIYQT
jgi:glutathione peroxidase